VRLLGDRYEPAIYSSSKEEPPPLPSFLHEKLTNLAAHEPDVQVRGQCASSAKRFLGVDGLGLIRELLYRSEDAQDKHNPLLIWWALESKATSDRAGVVSLLHDSALWQTPLFSQYITTRLGQRYTADRTPENLKTAAQLLALAPTPQAQDALIEGMERGLAGERLVDVPEELQKQVAAIWAGRPHTATLIGFAVRLNHAAATTEAVKLLSDHTTPEAERKQLLELLASRTEPSVVPVATDLLRAEKKESARIDLVNALAHYNDPEIGGTFLHLFPGAGPKLRAALIGAVTRRAEWARAFLQLVSAGEVKRETLTPGDLFALQSLHDDQVDALVKKNWGSLRTSSQAKEQMITNVRKLLAAHLGDAEKGHALFTTRCAICHTLNGEGAKIGPELTGYERDNLDFMIPAIVDPSLAIREEYVAFTITTKSGQALTGFLTENEPKFVTVKDLAGTQTRLAREEIASLNALPVSVMPEGLLDTMSDAEIRDLFTYLMKK
jgi:putative heme-binding domain-containing protein